MSEEYPVVYAAIQVPLLGIWSGTATLLKSSWNCLKSSPVVGGGDIIVLSGDDVWFAGGKASWSEISSFSSVTSSCVSEDPGIGGDGDCGALDFGGLGDLRCCALYTAYRSQ